jgi:hypothetical protein
MHKDAPPDEATRTGGRKGPVRGKPSGKVSKGDRDVQRSGDGVDRDVGPPRH